MRRVLTSISIELALPVVLIGLWWVISSVDNSLFVPSLHAIVDNFGNSEFRSQILSALGASGLNFVIGMAIAISVGIGLGIVLGSTRFGYAAVFPLLELFRAAPAVAILPIAIVFFGIGMEMKIIIIAFAAVWPILLNTIDGVRGIEPLLKETTRSYRLRPHDRVISVTLPAIAPQVVAGIRTSLSIGIAVIIISEMAGSTKGLGYFILNAQRTYSYPEMWAGTIVLGVAGYLVNLSFRAVEKSLLRRHGPTMIGER